MKSARDLWQELKERYVPVAGTGLSVDLSRMDVPDAWVDGMRDQVARAYDEMARVEAGEHVNTDEDRMVGHYWLRDPQRAPTKEIARAVEETVGKIRAFAADVHAGKIAGERAPFSELVVVGIGGSALGPQLVAVALGSGADKMRPHFIDNTDPDGIDAVFDRLGDAIERTLTVVISKSGGTKETRNGMLEAEARYTAAGLHFARHAVAVTGEGSELDKHATSQKWLARFPMWDWVGGRTSELSAVGLLPAALQGLDVAQLLAGARACDEATRKRASTPLGNPAMALALAWFHEGGGRGAKDMVVLPYKDRLALFSRYLQQLVMESLGKERDRDGKIVHQGIAVYGNKGSTDQHAYVQQLREGVPNFFVVFIEVLRDRRGASIEVEPGVTSGDYLSGFYQGTRRALYDNARRSITLTLDDVDAFHLGALIALFERAVGYYAALVHINAYHQPGVEAGKKAAAAVIAVQKRVVDELRRAPGQGKTAEEIAAELALPDEVETIFHICRHLAANPHHGIAAAPAADPFATRFSARP